jgi:hypothetical protein
MYMSEYNVTSYFSNKKTRKKSYFDKTEYVILVVWVVSIDKQELHY